MKRVISNDEVTCPARGRDMPAHMCESCPDYRGFVPQARPSDRAYIECGYMETDEEVF